MRRAGYLATKRGGQTARCPENVPAPRRARSGLGGFLSFGQYYVRRLSEEEIATFFASVNRTRAGIGPYGEKITLKDLPRTSQFSVNGTDRVSARPALNG